MSDETTVETPLTELGITTATIYRLGKAGINTIEAVRDYHGVNGIESVSGIGQATAEQILTALDEFERRTPVAAADVEVDEETTEVASEGIETEKTATTSEETEVAESATAQDSPESSRNSAPTEATRKTELAKLTPRGSATCDHDYKTLRKPTRRRSRTGDPVQRRLVGCSKCPSRKWLTEPVGK